MSRPVPLPLVIAIACGLAAAVGCGGKAETAVSAAEVALYDGPDRLQRLVDGAKREGELTIYTSAPVDDMTALTSAFTEKYGVKVEVFP